MSSTAALRGSIFWSQDSAGLSLLIQMRCLPYGLCPAVAISYFKWIPSTLAALSKVLVSHSTERADNCNFAACEVSVRGYDSSALEAVRPPVFAGNSGGLSA